MSDAIRNYFKKIFQGGEEPIGGDGSSPLEDMERDESEINPLSVGERFKRIQDKMKGKDKPMG
jgi:hypothetical protein